MSHHGVNRRMTRLRPQTDYTLVAGEAAHRFRQAVDDVLKVCLTTRLWPARPNYCYLFWGRGFGSIERHGWSHFIRPKTMAIPSPASPTLQHKAVSPT